MKAQDATEVAFILYNEIFSRFGAPRTIVSDRYRNFMSKLVKALWKMFEVKRHFKSSYHQQTNSKLKELTVY